MDGRSLTSYNLQTLVSLNTQDRLDLLDGLRRNTDWLKDGTETMEALRALWLEAGDGLSSEERKILLRLLQHGDAYHERLENSLMASLTPVAPLAAYRIGALGGCGGQGALDLLQSPIFENTPSLFLAKQLRRALSRIKRRLAPRSSIDFESANFPQHASVLLHCLPGIEGTLSEEIREILTDGLQRLVPEKGEGRVVIWPEARSFPATVLTASRLMRSWSLADAGAVRVGRDEDWQLAVAHAFCASVVSSYVKACSREAVRFAVRFEQKDAAASSALATFAATLESSLNQHHGQILWVNEPRDEDWTFHFFRENHDWSFRVSANPKHWDDRFHYRKRLLPASSHPALAAYLARLAAPLPSNCRVHDPFCGSGIELIETALLFPSAVLSGSDLSKEALAAALENQQAAGVCIERLDCADVMDVNLRNLDLVITNPPFGRRTRTASLHSLLLGFLQKVREWLKPDGKLVWITPAPSYTRSQLEACGLRLVEAHKLDMGGMAVEAQIVAVLPRSMGYSKGYGKANRSGPPRKRGSGTKRR